MNCPGDSGGTMVTLRMVMPNTVVRHRWVVAADMLGRVMVLRRDLFSVLRVVLLRGRMARAIGSGEATAVIVVI